MKYSSHCLLLKNTAQKTVVILLSMLTLIACENASKSNTEEHTKESENITVPENATKSTHELIAPSDMRFISHNQIKLLVDISKQGGIPAYLSIYSSYKELEEAQWQVNYDSRMLASSLTQDITQHTFSVPQHLNKVLVQLWFYDGRAAISREVATNKNSNEEITISL